MNNADKKLGLAKFPSFFSRAFRVVVFWRRLTFLQTRSQVLRFGGEQNTCSGGKVTFKTNSIKIFLGTAKLGGTAPEPSPRGYGLTSLVVYLQSMTSLLGLKCHRQTAYLTLADELIRQVTINCAERGLLLLRVRDEIRMTIAAYQTLYESSVAFGMRKALQAEQGKADMEKKVGGYMMLGACEWIVLSWGNVGSVQRWKRCRNA